MAATILHLCYLLFPPPFCGRHVSCSGLVTNCVASLLYSVPYCWPSRHSNGVLPCHVLCTELVSTPFRVLSLAFLLSTTSRLEALITGELYLSDPLYKLRSEGSSDSLSLSRLRLSCYGLLSCCPSKRLAFGVCCGYAESTGVSSHVPVRRPEPRASSFDPDAAEEVDRGAALTATSSVGWKAAFRLILLPRVRRSRPPPGAAAS